jgi:hypothetical protein
MCYLMRSKQMFFGLLTFFCWQMLLNKEECMWEISWILNETCNNQWLLDLHTIFEQCISSTHLQCFGGILAGDMSHERQVRWCRSCGLSWINTGTSHDINRQWDEFFSPCQVYVMWGCCMLKFGSGWFVWAWSMRNGWTHHSFWWCSLLWMNFDDIRGCIFVGISQCNPMIQKVSPCYATS